jgi:hypothetical protein
MATIPKRKPLVRKISAKAVVEAIEGPEPPYPVYRFSRRVKFERPKHNPFRGL